ncbi:MAG: acid phosphatase [Legionella sp.]|nr:MAG: acid phosphatase [Legionella sp.]
MNRFDIRSVLSLSLGLISALIIGKPSFAEPANLGLIRHEIRNYYNTGLYQQELTKKIHLAHQYIIQQAKQNQGQSNKLALVLDIDETSLSNYQTMAKRDFVGSAQQIHSEIMAAKAPVIKPMLTLYKEAQQHGITVFFVTGRKESERNATQINLKKAGYSGWGGLYLRPDSYTYQSIIPFKSQSRAAITKQGYKIIATIGDQYSDIKGGYAQKGFKLPNPFYYLP